MKAAAGGGVGVGMMVAMRYGLARGIYANEAGYGTAAVAYGTAQTDRPARQGLNAMVEVYIVSFVTSTISAMTVLLSGEWATSGLKSTALVAKAFSTVIPYGGLLVMLCVLLFGTSCMIGWGYYGEQFLHYVFGDGVVKPYRWIYAGLAIVGATRSVDLVWASAVYDERPADLPQPDRRAGPVGFGGENAEGRSGAQRYWKIAIPDAPSAHQRKRNRRMPKQPHPPSFFAP